MLLDRVFGARALFGRTPASDSFPAKRYGTREGPQGSAQPRFHPNTSECGFGARFISDHAAKKASRMKDRLELMSDAKNLSGPLGSERVPQSEL